MVVRQSGGQIPGLNLNRRSEVIRPGKMICPDRILAPRSQAFGNLLRFPERSQRAGEITVCFQCLCDPEISALDIPLEVGVLASRAPQRFADCESFPVAFKSALFVTQIRGVGIS